MKKIKVLIIAYACEPNKGSEPGVGWNWAVNLSKYVDVTVITRANNRKVIEKELLNNKHTNLNFIYFDIPILSKIKKYTPFGINLYFLLWEFLLMKKIKSVDYDLVQRVTFVSLVSTLRLYKLKKPYLLSFCGGGELTPETIYSNYSLIDKLKENLRIFYNSAYRYCPVTKKLYNKSNMVITVTDETKNFISKLGYNRRTITEPAIGMDINENYNLKKRSYRLIYAGSLIYFKNVDILIKSLSKVRCKNIVFDIYGSGNNKRLLKKLTEIYNIIEKVNFINPIPRNELLQIYKDYDLAVHASSHDSGSMFLLESISAGTPVLFLDTGGPKEIFKDLDYPLKVNPNQSIDNIVSSFAEKIDWFYEHYDEFMSDFQYYRDFVINKYNWDAKAKPMIKIYEKVLNENTSSS
jgi:glycosyltransferase involved in cell wall biosynthesis